MNRRPAMALLTAFAAIGLVIPSLASPAAAQSQRPSTGFPEEWCSTIGPPCVSSASRDGVAIDSMDPDWAISASGSSSTGEFLVQWDIDSTATGGSYVDMGTGEVTHLWSVTIDMGTHIPRVTDTYGDDVVVDRDPHMDGTYDVTITGYPVIQGVNNDCNVSVTPAVCPPVASQDVTNFAGEIGDFDQWNDASQRADFYGMDSWTNVEETDIPPEISGDPLQIVEPLANSHELHSGAVFQGFYHVVLPNQFLVDMGVDDPATLGTDGLAATIGAGTVTITPGPSSVEVDATGITFSHRTLRVKRGDVTPTRPKLIHLRRSSSHHARVSFHRSKAKGSRITGYQMRCYARHHATRKVSGKHSPLVDKHLLAGVSYHCQVRAKSKAGYGRWSIHRTLAKHS